MTGPKYPNDKAILRPNVEMNCNDIFCDIFSGARGMLKSLRNHRQSQQPTGQNGGLLGADAEKNEFFMVIKSIAIEFVPASRWD